MSNYRQIHTKIWKDDWYMELSPEEKLLFVYLFSNDNSNLIGLYKIAIKIISNETGLDLDFIKGALEKFEANQRAVFRNNIIWVVHMWRYHNNASPKVQTRIKNELDFIPDVPIKHWYQYYQDTGIFDTAERPILYPYSIHTTSEEEESNLKQEESKEEEEAYRESTPFDTTRKFIETLTGLPAMPQSVQAINEIIQIGCTQEDITAGYKWYQENVNKPLKYYGQLVGPARTAMAQRLRANNTPQQQERSILDQVVAEALNARKREKTYF